MATKENGNDTPLENLLGCSSKLDLYNKLLEKSALVFPEYNVVARRGISRHTADLILATDCFNGQFIELKYKFNTRNLRLIKHLDKLAERGFAIYVKAQHRGKFKINIERIKIGWLNIDHQKTDFEFQKEAVARINVSMKNILDISQKYEQYSCQIAAQLEFLEANLEWFIKNISESE